MNEDDQDKSNIENKEEEVKSEENQSQVESTPTDAQTTESSDLSIESNENQSETQLEIGEKTAASITEFFKDENNRKLIDNLKLAGLVFIDDNKDNNDNFYIMFHLSIVILIHIP